MDDFNQVKDDDMRADARLEKEQENKPTYDQVIELEGARSEIECRLENIVDDAVEKATDGFPKRLKDLILDGVFEIEIEVSVIKK